MSSPPHRLQLSCKISCKFGYILFSNVANSKLHLHLSCLCRASDVLFARISHILRCTIGVGNPYHQTAQCYFVLKLAYFCTYSRIAFYSPLVHIIFLFLTRFWEWHPSNYSAFSQYNGINFPLVIKHRSDIYNSRSIFMFDCYKHSIGAFAEHRIAPFFSSVVFG